MDKTLQMYIDKLNKLNFKEMYEGDFFLTWDKTDDELEAVFTVADALRYMRENRVIDEADRSRGIQRDILGLFGRGSRSTGGRFFSGERIGTRDRDGLEVMPPFRRDGGCTRCHHAKLANARLHSEVGDVE